MFKAFNVAQEFRLYGRNEVPIYCPSSSFSESGFLHRNLNKEYFLAKFKIASTTDITGN